MRPQNVNGLIPLMAEVNTDLDHSESLLFSQEFQKIRNKEQKKNITYLKKVI